MKKATQKSNSALLFGDFASGKSTAIRMRILDHKFKSVLWISFDNANALEGPEVSNWDLVEPNSWQELKAEVLDPLRSGKIGPYDAIVMDGLATASNYALAFVANGAEFVKQSDWAVMASLMRDTLVFLRARCKRFFASVPVVLSATDTPVLALNRDTYNKVLPLFDKKVYCFGKPEKNKEGVTVGVKYLTQENSLLALKLKG